MSTPVQVETFYERIWHAGDLEAAADLLTEAFVFRGSLGAELQGRGEFLAYVRAVRSALADYHCEILECVTESDRAFAQMRFSGRHVGVFRGFQPTGKPVHWWGAALFRFEGSAIAQLWVLGDLLQLEGVLKANAAIQTGRPEHDRAALTKIQQELAKAWVGGDRAAIERIIAPEWRSTGPDGRSSDRSQVIGDVFEKRVHRIRGLEIDNVRVQVFGDTAVVTGRTHGTGDFAGTPYDVVIRFTDTFVRRANQWQAVASHSSLEAPR